MGEPLDSFKTLHEKRLYRKLMQILNDPTHPMRHYFDSRRSNRSGRFLLPRTNKNRYKASFLPSAPSDSSGAVWESRWLSWAVRPNEPSGFRGRKDLLNRASALVNWHLRTLSNTSPSAPSGFNKIIPVINWVCACVKTPIEDNFLKEGWGCVSLMIFI